MNRNGYPSGVLVCGDSASIGTERLLSPNWSEPGNGRRRADMHGRTAIGRALVALEIAWIGSAQPIFRDSHKGSCLEPRWLRSSGSPIQSSAVVSILPFRSGNRGAREIFWRASSLPGCLAHGRSMGADDYLHVAPATVKMLLIVQYGVGKHQWSLAVVWPLDECTFQQSDSCPGP